MNTYRRSSLIEKLLAYVLASVAFLATAIAPPDLPVAAAPDRVAVVSPVPVTDTATAIAAAKLRYERFHTVATQGRA